LELENARARLLRWKFVGIEWAEKARYSSIVTRTLKSLSKNHIGARVAGPGNLGQIEGRQARRGEALRAERRPGLPRDLAS
jgi:hypothetical protein